VVSKFCLNYKNEFFNSHFEITKHFGPVGPFALNDDPGHRFTDANFPQKEDFHKSFRLALPPFLARGQTSFLPRSKRIIVEAIVDYYECFTL
jgi:hypothetical protein